MRKVLKVLKPFEEATKEASFKFASLAIVIPLVNALYRQMEVSDEDGQGVKTTKRQLLQLLKSRFGDIESCKHYVLATILDTRYKHRCFSSAYKASAASEMLTRECQNFHEAESDLPLPKRVKPNYSDTSLLGTVVDMMADTHEEEDLELQEDTFGISSYLQEPNLPIYTATSSSSKRETIHYNTGRIMRRQK